MNKSFKKLQQKLANLNYQIIVPTITGILIFIASIWLAFTVGKNNEHASMLVKMNHKVAEQSKLDDKVYGRRIALIKDRKIPNWKKVAKLKFYNNPSSYHPTIVIDQEALAKRPRRNYNDYPHYPVQTLTMGNKNAKFYRLQTTKHNTAIRFAPLTKKAEQKFHTGISKSSFNINYQLANYASDDYFALKKPAYKKVMKTNNEVSLKEITNSHQAIPAFTNYLLNMQSATYLPSNRLLPQEAQPFTIIKPNWYAGFRFIRNFWVNNCSAFNNNNVHEIMDYNGHQYFRTAIDGLYIKDTDLSKINNQPAVIAQNANKNNSVAVIKNTDLKMTHHIKDGDYPENKHSYRILNPKWDNDLKEAYSGIVVNYKLFNKHTIAGKYYNKATKKTSIVNLNVKSKALKKVCKLPKEFLYVTMRANRINELSTQSVLIPTKDIISINGYPLKIGTHGCNWTHIEDFQLAKKSDDATSVEDHQEYIKQILDDDEQGSDTGCDYN